MKTFWPFLVLFSAASARSAVRNSGSSQHEQQVEAYPPPMPYKFKYEVLDEDSGNNFNRREEQDSQGNLSGEYRLLLPDGRIQVVTYTATHYGGFVAKVSYEGGDAKDADDEKSFRPSPSYNPNQQQDQSQQPWRTKKY